ncbi:MAG: RNA polymerase factor sigma-54 [Alphaproteobacteria bacterium]|nr:RNA polymerase factor sigma-54 [Alphaproteobacteria bacterium]
MALTPRLELRQGQSLVMTPQLQQAIKLLQLSNLELSAYVEEELQKNPLLERDERPEGGEAERAAEAPAASTGGDPVEADVQLREDVPSASGDTALDTEYDNVYAEDSAHDAAPEAVVGAGAIDWSRAGGGANRHDGDEMAFDATLTRNLSLHDHLTEQMQISVPEGPDRLIAAYLIDMVDEAGYLEGDLLSASARLGASIEDIERVLAILQTCDPTGVCARSLAECLSLQLREKNRLDPAMVTLLENLDLLAKRDLAALMRLCGVDAEDLSDMIAEIRALTPKPGLQFGGEPVQPVVPDVFVQERNDGAWHVELNTDTLPRVLVNGRYYSRVTAKARSKEEKTYISDCLNNATWLVKSLDQRARTILKVATEIVRQQDAFLAKGVAHLRPLNLRMVAEAISMHESTVSRVTSNKYIATPRGVFELKYFFTSAIAATDGRAAHSAEAVRHKIRDLINAESAPDVLSDDRIVEVLKEAGIDIARRTVAKYREAMRIPSSVERRRQKLAAHV